jgi:D-alanyl-D-alanine carboxypeptidase/D-alanyl-D-alanine-endopeptidase (penicillin-binding protein 4)
MNTRKQTIKNYKPLQALIASSLIFTGAASFIVGALVLTAGVAEARTHGRVRHTSSSVAGAASGGSKKGASIVGGGTVAQTVDAWMKRPEIAHSRIGVEVMELPSGRLIYSHDGDRRLTPASTAKVMTTSCAYELLGPNFQYKTTLAGCGPVLSGVLKGDLVLEPSQDPSFDRGDLMRLVDDLKSGKGGERVNQIEGHAYVGEVPGGKESFQPTWLSEDFGQDWMPASSSLVMDRNIAYLSGFPKQFKVSEDKSTGYALLDCLLSSGEASSWVSFDSSSGTFHVLRGTALAPNGKHDPAIKHDGPFVIANPDAYNQAIFQATLADRGITLSAGREGRGDAHVLAEHQSKPLSLIIKHCLYESDNLYAQQLLRTIGATTLGAGAAVQGKAAEKANEKISGATLEERGLNRLADWLSSIGVPNSEVVLFDGCGLSRKDCISPHALNLVLKHMAGPDVNGPYLNLMHQTGAKDGSGRFSLKTGAMDTVRGITGVLNNFSGQHLAVTAIINGHTPSVKNVRMALGDLVERLKRVKLPPAEPQANPVDAQAVATPAASAPAAAAPVSAVKNN